jgi:hypothetical protein
MAARQRLCFLFHKLFFFCICYIKNYCLVNLCVVLFCCKSYV